MDLILVEWSSKFDKTLRNTSLLHSLWGLADTDESTAYTINQLSTLELESVGVL